MNDKRKVSTDALETLGTFIGEGEKRDAIHLAVVPVKAGEILLPGNHVVVKDGVAFYTKVNGPGGVGIVDPFLPRALRKGERFWLVIYPRKITSLRHVWSHPDFPEEAPPEAPANEKSKDESMQWLTKFFKSIGIKEHQIDDAIQIASEHRDGWGLYLFNKEGNIPAEFWDHIEVVADIRIPDASRASYFSCSC